MENARLLEGEKVVIGSDTMSTKSKSSSASVVVVRTKSALSKPHLQDDVVRRKTILSFMGHKEA
jgi:hypothetical protein